MKPTCEQFEINALIQHFWENGGKEKYKATVEAREANGIPPDQFIRACLFAIIDDSKIIFEE